MDLLNLRGRSKPDINEGDSRAIVSKMGVDERDDFSAPPIERDRLWRHPSEIGQISRMNKQLRLVRFLGWVAIGIGIALLASEALKSL